MEKITPILAVEILAKHGTVISLEEAAIILDFLHNMSILAINQLQENGK